MTKLTHEQIDAKEAGPEMDRLMATLVMGWEKNKDITGWMPSQEVGAAWWAVEKLDSLGYYCLIWTHPKIVQIYRMEDAGFCADVKADELPEAICRAALKAVIDD